MSEMDHSKNIRAFLVSHLEDASLGYPIMYENVKQKEPTKGTYLRFWFSDSDILRAELGRTGIDFRNGIAQVDVVTEAYTGTSTTFDIAYQVEKTLHRDLSGRYPPTDVEHPEIKGTPVRIIRVVKGIPVQSDNHYMLPITIYWESHTPPVQ